LIVDLSLSANNRNNPNHTAGTTFLGQFLEHDVTFDADSRLGQPTVPQRARNYRTPSLDLDSVLARERVGRRQRHRAAFAEPVAGLGVVRDQVDGRLLRGEGADALVRAPRDGLVG
jgi:hypothetical protein